MSALPAVGRLRAGVLVEHASAGGRASRCTRCRLRQSPGLSAPRDPCCSAMHWNVLANLPGDGGFMQGATNVETTRSAPAPQAGAGMAVTKLLAPRVVKGSWVECHEHAAAHNEPVFVDIKLFADDRGWSAMNLLSGVLRAEGQINFSMQYPGVVKAWHCHTRQTDFWMCAVGNIKAGVHRAEDATTWMTLMGEKKPGILIIPPGLWHGATAVGGEAAGLLYYVTHAYDDVKPDELRRPWDSIEGFPWGIRHG